MSEVLRVGNKLISTPIWDILQHIRESLTNGKLRIIKRQGDRNIRVSCPHHKNGKEANADCDVYIGKSNESVQYGTAKCFACGYKSDFVGFVSECFDESYEWAKQWLITNYADGTIEYQIDLEPIVLDSSASRGKKYLDESFLDKLEPYHPYLEKRKITKEVAKEFEVKYNPETKTIVFPVRDETGKLFMCTQRSVEGKTFIIDANKQKPIYLLYYLKQHNIQEAFICESQINALTLWTHGWPGVALFGTGAQHQYDILNKSNIRIYNLCFDGDDAGDKGIKKFLENIRKDVIVNIIRLPRGKDINDLSYDEVEKLVLTMR